MKSKKILFIIIPLILIVLVLGGGFTYLMLNSTPEKIFTSSINKVFDTLTNEKEKIKTLKGKVTLSGSIDSEDEEIQAINDILETSSITIDMAVDEQNMVLNESVDVTYDAESILYATILLQDEKGYVYLPNWLDKYLQIPEEELNYSELAEILGNTKTLNQNQLLEAIQTELLNLISKQEFTQRKNGKIKESILDLSQEEFYSLYREMCINLKQNENFNNALGDYKEDVIDIINDMIEEFTDYEADESSRAVISICTEGLFNKFRGFSVELKDEADIVAGIQLTFDEENYKFSMYEQYDEEREEHLKVLIEDKKENKNKGTATITISAEEEEYVIIYKYENKENQTNFIVTTEIDGVVFEVLGNTLKEGNNYKGKLGLSFELEEGTININADYNFAYGVEIEKINIVESVLIDELTEEDQEEMMNNLENSPLMPLVVEWKLFEKAEDAAQQTTWENKGIQYNGKTVIYNIPTLFELKESSSQERKIYTDGNNSITISVEENDMDDYLNKLNTNYILTSDEYENKEISELLDYEANDKKYKYRTITYTIDGVSYVNLYFVYELEEGFTYVVEVESKGGQISLDDINMFLDVEIGMSPMQQEDYLASGKVNVNGEWVNIEDLANVL